MNKASRGAFNNDRHEILKLLTREKMEWVAKDIGISYLKLFYFKEGICATETTKRKIKMFLQRKIKD